MANFSLDTALREACASDLQNKCQASLAAMDKNEEVREAALNCLQSYREELESDQCKAEVCVCVYLCALHVFRLAVHAGLHCSCTHPYVRLCMNYECVSVCENAGSS